VGPKQLLLFPFTVPLDGAGKMRDPAQDIYARSMARALAERLSGGGILDASCATLTSHGRPGEVESSDPKDHGWVVTSQPWSLEEACALPLPDGAKVLLHGGAELTDRVRLRLLLVDQQRERLLLDQVVLRPRDELFAALEEAAQAVAGALSEALPQARWPTRDVEAFVAYLRGRDTSAAHELGVHVLEPARSFDGYLEAVRRDPDFTEAQERMLTLALDFALGGRGPAQAAREACERLLSQDPKSHRACAALAEIELAAQRPAVARQWLEKLLELRPDWTPAFPRLAAALLALGDGAHALVWLDAALAEQPDDAGLLCARGDALELLGRGGDAIETWQRALILDPSRAGLHERLARALAAAGRRSEARSHQRALDRLAGKGAPSLTAQLGLGLRALGQFVRRLTAAPR